MKKLLLTIIIVVSMSLVSFANDVNAKMFNSNGGNIESIENADPHTKQYEDIIKILDEYEQDIKKATTCEDLDKAEIAMLLKVMALAENSYTEEATPEESKEIQERMNRIESDVQKLQQQWGCALEENGGEE